jgi:hypothetical protein
MNHLSRAIAVTFLITGAVAAQDIVGRWVGTADTTDEGGTKRQEKQTFEIKSEDGKLTGMLVSRSGTAAFPSRCSGMAPNSICTAFSRSMVESTSAGSSK